MSSSDKDEQDGEAVSSMLGFQSYWDSAYADELANFREHGHAGEVWYGLERRQLASFPFFHLSKYYVILIPSIVTLSINQSINYPSI